MGGGVDAASEVSDVVLLGDRLPQVGLHAVLRCVMLCAVEPWTLVIKQELHIHPLDAMAFSSLTQKYWC